MERSEERLAKSVYELAKQSNRADLGQKKRHALESDNSTKEEENDKLESQLKSDKFTLAESERKYEDLARKLATKVRRGCVDITMMMMMMIVNRRTSWREAMRDVPMTRKR